MVFGTSLFGSVVVAVFRVCFDLCGLVLFNLTHLLVCFCLFLGLFGLRVVLLLVDWYCYLCVCM